MDKQQKHNLSTLIRVQDCKISSFKTELKELLKKHKAFIGCDIQGDTYNIECTMVVGIEAINNFITIEHDLCDGRIIDRTRL